MSTLHGAEASPCSLCRFGHISCSAFLWKTKKQNTYDERRLLEQHRWIQEENGVPNEFPNFVREGFTGRVVTSDDYVKRDSGLIFCDIEVGEGDFPKAGQQF
ncbi:peptidyl-prolyl cis-trans isomerase FKBP20-2, chloroplastic-like [Primulina tabacum]|uniref:peptidyl-prolyl cis-trans isomerase FKBP20-2, chloroplastic-like n=1 Tax=Primulina tabacum TaxID=48773 RepID=UPI003F5914DD